MEQWAQWYERSENDRVVAKTEIGDTLVSTVFLGIDHQFGSGPPLIFETMIFGGEYDQYQVRSSTWSEAESEHEVACSLVRGGMH